jgi:hypothetical protein
MARQNKLPTPGLRGSYEGSCVICMRGCDTAFALQGQAEWITAGLMKLGVSDIDEASAIVSKGAGSDPGMLPNGIITVVVRCCESCMSKSGLGMNLGLVAAGEPLPCYSQRPRDKR